MMLRLIFSLFLAFAPVLSHAQDSSDDHATPESQAPAAEAAAPTHEGTTPPTEAAAHGEHAAEATHGGGHHAEGIPVAVLFQAINFAIFMGLLIYLLRKPISNFFKTREQTYKQALMRGENARRDAEKKKREIQDRLTHLESTADESIATARAEAAVLMSQISFEAEELANRLRQEANKTAELEIEKARSMIREELLNQSVALSRKMLNDKIAEPDQKRLQTEFADKIAEKQSEVI